MNDTIIFWKVFIFELGVILLAFTFLFTMYKISKKKNK